MMTQSLNVDVTTNGDDFNSFPFLNLDASASTAAAAAAAAAPPLSPLPNLPPSDTTKHPYHFDAPDVPNFVNAHSSTCTPASATINIQLDSDDEQPILPAVNLDEFAKGTEQASNCHAAVPSVHDVLASEPPSPPPHNDVVAACDAMLDDGALLLKEHLIECSAHNTYGELDDDDNGMAHLLLDAPITDSATPPSKDSGEQCHSDEQQRSQEATGKRDKHSARVVNPDVQDVSHLISYLYSQQATDESDGALLMRMATCGASAQELKKWHMTFDVQQLCKLRGVQHNAHDSDKFSKLLRCGWKFDADAHSSSAAVARRATPPATPRAQPLAHALGGGGGGAARSAGDASSGSESADIERLLALPLPPPAHKRAQHARQPALSSCVRINDGEHAVGQAGAGGEELLDGDALLMVQDYEPKHLSDDNVLDLLDVSDSNARLHAMVHHMGGDELGALDDARDAPRASASPQRAASCVQVVEALPDAVVAAAGAEQLQWGLPSAWGITSTEVTPSRTPPPDARCGAHKRAAGVALNVSDEELLRTRPKKKRRAAKFEKPVPSRFCHVCSRTPKNVRLAVCARIREGTCRKVICEKCFAKYSYGDFSAALRLTSAWLCPHCRDACPQRAQCRTYQRINDRLRVSRLRQESAAKRGTPDTPRDDARARKRGRRGAAPRAMATARDQRGQV